MRARTLADVAAVTGGRPAGEATVTGAATDDREVARGDLFVAVPGERVDGHAFVDRAFGRGAAAALVARDGTYAGPTVRVADTRTALLELAADERGAMTATVVGITGSSGKTSVKDLTAAVLASRFRVAASRRSFNTEVGLPLTLLEAPADAEVVVCEMGSRGPGHIRLLCEIARPSIGIVTNVGVAHLEMFGSRSAIADAKAELAEALPEDGVAVLNGDDAVVRDFATRTAARVVLYGSAPDADVRAEDLELDAEGRARFTLRSGDAAEQVGLPLVGEHMASNALAAAACGIALGLEVEGCAAALRDARVSPWRMETFETPDGIRVVNDAYNANPASMAAALKAARWIAGPNRCVAVLGEMAELGDIADEEHERVGELLARLGVAPVVVVGERARRIAVGAVREGVEPQDVTVCDTVDEAVAWVTERVRRGDVVLVKGSRIAGLERVAERLRGPAADVETAR